MNYHASCYALRATILGFLSGLYFCSSFSTLESSVRSSMSSPKLNVVICDLNAHDLCFHATLLPKLISMFLSSYLLFYGFHSKI